MSAFLLILFLMLEKEGPLSISLQENALLDPLCLDPDFCLTR